MPSLQIIQQFQKEIGVEREEFLQALENTRGPKNARITAFYRQLLEDLIEELQQEGIAPEQAEQWMRERVQQAVQDRDLARLMVNAMGEDFQQVSRFLDQRFSLLDRTYNMREARILARRRLNDYILDGGKNIGNRLAVEIGALSQIYEREELYGMIRDKLNVTGHRLETVTDNIIRGYDSEVVDSLAAQTGLTLWNYEGTLIENSRRFCVRLVRGEYVFTKAQILRMDNGHGLNPFTFRGGYNCRHTWSPGEEGWPGFENPWPDEVPFVTMAAKGGEEIITIPQL